MKTKCLALAVALMSVCPVLSWGQVADPLEDVLILYDFNALKCDWANTPPAFCAPCVWATDLSLDRLSQGLLDGGPDGTKFRSFDDWDSSYDYSFARTDFSAVSGTLSYDVYVRADAIANISGVSFDWQRLGNSSVDAIQATIFWEGPAGSIQYCSSGPIALDGTESWNSRELDFPIDVTPLPTGIDTSGKQFHIEFYAWGNNGGALLLDNVALKGMCAPIPEPGGAILIAAAGMALLLRRRVRA
ncbi:MAG: PEP-CTERM sorting domain-containing protein [Prosthecobacter sp.]|uniref:PEP-CTERM sorting domain-containing protein n=1 Tax=Prosthecobacter sp. TaxID=1965333 RepID=UPI0038FDFE2C